MSKKSETEEIEDEVTEKEVDEAADETSKKEEAEPLSELDQAKADAAEYKDKYVRLLAEFDNARKRMEREKQDFVKYANEGLLVEFLAILDDLERTLTAAQGNHDDQKSFEKGVEMVMAHVYEMLKKNDVKPTDSEGKPFDPNSQEILMQEETEEYEEGFVIEEFQKGYTFGEKVIRTAKVKVAKKPEDKK